MQNHTFPKMLYSKHFISQTAIQNYIKSDIDLRKIQYDSVLIKKDSCSLQSSPNSIVELIIFNIVFYPQKKKNTLIKK